ncbi:DNA polymerase III subunit beta [Patescibacteria group bacterium]|nr:DNA polymerase III subunit beta [Patescibacteria group bacterium]
MNLICLQENFKKALNIAGRIIGRNLTLPILNNILLSIDNNKLKISSTNLEVGINTWVSGKVEEEGSITVPAKIMSDFINNLPNKKIEIKTKGNQLTIKCEKLKAVLNGLPADDYPIIPKIKDKPIVKINGNILKDCFSQVVGMASISESRPEISGILMKFNSKSIKLVATDSFRLAEKNIEIENKIEKDTFIIIPQRTIQEIIRILSEKEDESDQEISIVLSNNQILFDLGNTQVISRLIDGQYPDYQQIIPNKTQTRLIVDRKELINSVRIASLFSGKTNNIKVEIDPSKAVLEISSKNADIGENKSQIKAEIDGDKLEVFFNHHYLLDGLNNIFSDKIEIGLNDSFKPVLIRPVGDINYTYIIMPIRV